MAKDFLDAIRNNPNLKEQLKDLPAPKNDQEAVAQYQKIAKDLGFDLSADEIFTSLSALEKEQREKTEKVALDDSALENVAGGAPGDYYGSICADSFQEGEWCWFTDSCAVVISDYSEYIKNSKIENAFGVCRYLDKDADQGYHDFDTDNIVETEWTYVPNPELE